MDLKNREKKKQLKPVKQSKKNRIIDYIIKYGLKNLIKVKPVKNILSKDNKKLKKTIYEIKTQKKIQSLNILFLSDIHLEIVNNSNEIARLLKEDSFDLILFGGDYLDKPDSFEEINLELKKMISLLQEKSNCPIISVMGNHDGYKVAQLMKENTNLLINSSYKPFKNVVVFGLEDIENFPDVSDKSFKLESNNFNILISHSPNINNKVFNDYDMILSGHTHGGQISLFGFSPIHHSEDKARIYGEWKYNNSYGITSSGVGCSTLPLRRGVQPEVVIIKIKN